jgi:hypothetical protein
MSDAEAQKPAEPLRMTAREFVAAMAVMAAGGLSKAQQRRPKRPRKRTR